MELPDGCQQQSYKAKALDSPTLDLDYHEK